MSERTSTEISTELYVLSQELKDLKNKENKLRSELDLVGKRITQVQGGGWGTARGDGLLTQLKKELERVRVVEALTGCVEFRGKLITKVTKKAIITVTRASPTKREMSPRDQRLATAWYGINKATVKEVLNACRAAGMVVPDGPEGE